MDALFSRTELVQAEALRQLKADQIPGQLDLVDALNEAPATVTAYLATDGHGGSNVHVMGWTCRDCDRTFDPHYRRGVPCVNANWHAKHTVSSWRINGVASARVVTVEIPDTGDRAQMAAAARQALADREASASWPDPFGVFYDRQELNGQLVIA